MAHTNIATFISSRRACDTQNHCMQAIRARPDFAPEKLFSKPGTLTWSSGEPLQRVRINFHPDAERSFVRVTYGDDAVLAFEALLPVFEKAKLRRVDDTHAGLAVCSERGGLEENKSLQSFPLELLRPLWEAQDEDSKALGVCLVECIRFEHIIRQQVSMPPRKDTKVGHKEKDHGCLGEAVHLFKDDPANRALIALTGLGVCLQQALRLRNYLVHGSIKEMMGADEIGWCFRGVKHAQYLVGSWGDLRRIHARLLEIVVEVYQAAGIVGPPPSLTWLDAVSDEVRHETVLWRQLGDLGCRKFHVALEVAMGRKHQLSRLQLNEIYLALNDVRPPASGEDLTRAA
jgi:hypothetical protein